MSDQPQQPDPYGQQPQQPQPGQPQPQQPDPYGQQPQPGQPPQQPPAPQYQQQPGYGAPQYQQQYQQQPLRPDEERTWGAMAHFGALLLGFLAPLLVYVIYKDRSPYLKESAGAALNFNISWMIWMFVSAMSMFLLVGFVLFPLVAIGYYVLVIVGGVKSLNNEIYNYPLTIKMVG